MLVFIMLCYTMRYDLKTTSYTWCWASSPLPSFRNTGDLCPAKYTWQAEKKVLKLSIIFEKMLERNLNVFSNTFGKRAKKSNISEKIFFWHLLENVKIYIFYGELRLLFRSFVVSE